MIFRRLASFLLAPLLALILLAPARAQDSTSSGLQLLLMGSGLHTNDWGTQTNANLSKIESAIVGASPISLTSGARSLTDAEARYAIITLSGTLSGNVTLAFPARARQWCVVNGATLGSYTVTASAGVGATVSLPAGLSCVVSNATDLAYVDNRSYALATTAKSTADTGVANAATAQSAADAAAATANAAMPKAGGTFTGDVVRAADPATADSLARRSYIDAKVAAAQGQFSGFRALKVANGATPDSQATVTANLIVLDDGTNFLNLRSLSVTASTGCSGAANCLDAGSVATNTWYAVWVIGKADGTNAALLSTSATAPTLPSGYTFKFRVGWVRTDASSRIYRFIQYGARVQWIVDGTLRTTTSIGTGGSSSYDISAMVPTTAVAVAAGVGGTNTAASIGPGSFFMTSINSNLSQFTFATFIMETSQHLSVSGTANGSINVFGWEDNL